MHSVTQLWLIWKSSIKTKSLNTKPCPVWLFPRIICQASPFLPKMSQNSCTHRVWTAPLSPEPLSETQGMAKNPTQQPKIYSFPPSEKPPLIDINLLLSKVSFLPHQTAMNDWSSPKQNFHFLHLSIPSLPPMLFQKPCLYYCLFSYFLNSLFYFKLYKISTDSTTPIGILWLCVLIKYNGFRISGNKSYETPYPMP